MHEDDQEILIKGLVRLLAGTLILRCKSRFFAWSLKGDDGLRDLFYKDYSVLDGLCDQLARLIVDLDGTVPGAYSTLARISSIAEDNAMTAAKMTARLIEDHRQLVNDTLFIKSLLPVEPGEKAGSLLDLSLDNHYECSNALSKAMANN